jgi:hypothetical protein
MRYVRETEEMMIVSIATQEQEQAAEAEALG